MSWKVFFVLLFIWSNFANAALMISPTRVVFDERQRTAQLVVINTTDQTKTYRLEWLDQVMNPDGSLKQILPPEILDTSIQSMVRVSPKQVRLAPGERQIIKVALRRSSNLEDKEYRSYLHFKALPNEQKKVTDNIGIRINMILSYNVPVIVRNTNREAKLAITNHSLLHRDGKGSLALEFERTAGKSTFGIIEAYFTPQGASKAIKAAVINDIALYPDSNKRFVTIPLIDNSALLQPGQFKVTYRGKKEYKNKIFAETSFFTTPKDIIKP